MDKLEKLGKELAYLLRHCPESKGLTMDERGWVNIDQLVTNAPEFTRENLIDIVKTDNKQRYSISSDGTKIRANQGHSINVNLDLEEKQPPDVLYHGTVERFLKSINEEGLKKMQRQYVHLSVDRETANDVGKRRGEAVILIVDAKAMHEDGFAFYQSENGIWLTDHVPVKYIRRE